MRSSRLLPVLALVLVVGILLPLLAQTYSIEISEVLEPSAYLYSVSVPQPQRLSDALTSYTFLYSIFPLEQFTRVGEHTVEASYTLFFCPLSQLSLQKWGGRTVSLEICYPAEIDRSFWAGGVRVTPLAGQAVVTVSGVDELMAVGACSASGSTVRVWGICMVSEPVYAVFTVVDPQGAMKIGASLLVNGTAVDNGVMYKYPGASVVKLKLEGARIGSVYVNGSKVGVGSGDTFAIPLENATAFIVRVVARGRMAVSISKAEVLWSDGEHARIRVAGRVVDADYSAPVTGALVQLFASGMLHNYGYSIEGGLFALEALVKTGGASRLKVTLTATHDDYEQASATATVVLSGGAGGPGGVPEQALALALASLAVAALAASAAAARAKAARRRRSPHLA
ncbi:MAG: hypothetical protein QXZ31_08295 [Thermofilaceae archaeon]